MKLTVLHSHDLSHFLSGIESVFTKDGHEVRRYCPRTVQELDAAMKWGDVVWCEFANEMAVAASQRQHPNLIVRLHAYEAFGLVAKVKWTNVNTLVHTSQHILKIATETAPPIAHVRKAFIPSGVDTDQFTPQPHDGKSFSLGVVAYISGKKQPGLWLQVLAQMGKRWTLHIAGAPQFAGDEWDRYLRDLTAKMGLADRVFFDGHVTDIAEWWKDKDYCLSASAREGCPYNVLEAMACGVKPLVHAYPGAEAQFKAKSLWRSVTEVPPMVQEKYEDGWRDGFEETYSLKAQTPALLALLGTEPKAVRPVSDEIKVGGITVDDGTAATPLDSQGSSRGETPRPSTILCSLAMIALVRDANEMLTLEKAIDSIEGVVDEYVIVLDDRSIPIVPWKPNMRLMRRKWTDSFSDARNFAADHARGAWLLILDADDHFGDVGNLRECMAVAPAECDAIVADCRNVDENGNLRDEEKQVVAYRPLSAHWEKRGHNQLTGYEKWADSTAVLVSVYPRDRDREKAERTLPLLLADFDEHPADQTTPYHIAKTYIHLHDFKNAREYAQMCVDMDPGNIVFVGAWHILVGTTLDTEGLDACEKVLLRALECHAKCPDLLHLAAFVATMRWAEAAQDAANPYGACVQTSRKYLAAFAKYGSELGWPIGEPLKEGE